MSEARLHLGDCLDVLRSMKAGSVDAIVTDPPYPKAFDHVWDIMRDELPRVMKDGSFLVTFCGHYQLARVLDAMRKGGLEFFWPAIATNAQQPIMHGFKAKCCHKPCLIFRKGKARPRRVFVDNFAMRLQTKSWITAQAAHKWGQADALFFEPIEAFSSPGEIVLDPFLGGGSVGVACMKTGRNFIGIEIDPAYFAIAQQRIQAAQEQLKATA